jgi:hypothetical protein
LLLRSWIDSKIYITEMGQKPPKTANLGWFGWGERSKASPITADRLFKYKKCWFVLVLKGKNTPRERQ